MRHRLREPTRTPSCAASPASARTWSTAPRSRSIRRRAASWRAWARALMAMRATRWCRSSSAPASPAPSLTASAPIRGSRASGSGKDVAGLGVIAYVPPQRTMLPEADEQPKTDAKRQALAARARCKTSAGIWAHIRRMCDAEGGVAELKNEHGMDRARCRGTSLFHVQVLLGCTALNVKRLASRGQAASGQAAGPPNAPQAAEEGAAEAAGADLAAYDDLARNPTGCPPIAPAASARWTITLSMN